MSRDPTLRLQDIIEACDRLGGYLDGYDWERFRADPRTQDAVARTQSKGVNALCLWSVARRQWTGLFSYMRAQRELSRPTAAR